ncbi:ATP-binding cassette domain-containing protein [Spongiactinospora sp. TRM90649]|uniref:ATP-binding cassette domain-containing protein n=1 Tax=Spongiactinospora sp. TRM90649 TaxID=3031114 RepID=UPI0023FA1F8F|nr:ATP-binding cassette domain-containing protein [Spongiactinospora sp. TRM90649]MDF5752457.1 ATP-binding cassette domain-containing protein [Spongiactinospora sp. TRM90649]
MAADTTHHRRTGLHRRNAPWGASPAIHTRALAKSYRGVPAVAGMDLTVEAGELFAFLGPNGAGKSTAIAMLCTLLRPTAGQARVAGVDVLADPAGVRRRIGVVFQDSAADGDLTVTENLRLHATMYGMGRHDARRRVAEALDLTGLYDERDTRARRLSAGQRRGLALARGLLTNPQVLFLDEPSLGLDPTARGRIWDHLLQLRSRRAVTVFLTTRHLEEAEHCDRVGILDRGRLIAHDSPAALKTVLGADRVHLRTADDRTAAMMLAQRMGLSATRGPDGLHLRVPDAAGTIPRLCAELRVPVLSIEVRRPSMDDVFLHYTGRAAGSART